MNSEKTGRLTDSGETSVDDALDKHKCSGIAELLLFLPLAVISSCAEIQQRYCGMKLQDHSVTILPLQCTNTGIGALTRELMK